MTRVTNLSIAGPKSLINFTMELKTSVTSFFAVFNILHIFFPTLLIILSIPLKILLNSEPIEFIIGGKVVPKEYIMSSIPLKIFQLVQLQMVLYLL